MRLHERYERKNWLRYFTKILHCAFQDPHFRAHRQKQRFIERLKHMRQNFATRKQLKEREQEEKAGGPHPPIVGLTSSYSLHDFHNFSVQVPYRQFRTGRWQCLWTGTARTAIFCRSGTETRMHFCSESSSESRFGSGFTINFNTKVKNSQKLTVNDRTTFWETKSVPEPH